MAAPDVNTLVRQFLDSIKALASVRVLEVSRFGTVQTEDWKHNLERNWPVMIPRIREALVRADRDMQMRLQTIVHLGDEITSVTTDAGIARRVEALVGLATAHRENFGKVLASCTEVDSSESCESFVRDAVGFVALSALRVFMIGLNGTALAIAGYKPA